MKLSPNSVRLAVLFLLLSISLTAPCTAQVQYAITDLGTLGGWESIAVDINNNGQIVGAALDLRGVAHAILWSGSGPMQDLGKLPESFSSAALGINNSGQVVGTVMPNPGVPLLPWVAPFNGYIGGIPRGKAAFLTSTSGPMLDIGTLGGEGNVAFDINDTGQVVGYSNTVISDGYAPHAFLYCGQGSLQDLGTLGGIYSVASSINNSGQIVGSSENSAGDVRAFFITGGGPMQEISTLGGAVSQARAINDRGQIVGTAETIDGYPHAFLYNGSGPLQDLGTLGGTFSRATAINNNGCVVGGAQATDGYSHAFVCSANVPLQDLNNLIAPGFGWILKEASGINVKGQIIATGQGGDPAGQSHAFLLSPLSTITTGTPTNTPGSALKPVDSMSGRLKRWDGSSWKPIDSCEDPNIHSDQPTVVLAHGWNDQIADDNWTASLANTLRQQNPDANILGYDWSDQAVSKPGQPAIPVVEDIFAEGLNGAAGSARRGSVQGVMLANDLKALGISNDKVQLIGHSNGGAVVGAAASDLSLGGQKVQRITTLDAPHVSLVDIPQTFQTGNPFLSSPSLVFTSVDAMQYVRTNSASQVEVYYSNGVLGRAALGFGAPLVDSSATNVFNGRIYPGPIADLSNLDIQSIDHNRITTWYGTDRSGATPGQDQFIAAVDWSILSANTGNWKTGNYTEQGLDSGVFGTTSVTQQITASLVKKAIDTFEDGTSWFGQHAEMFMRDASNFAVKITSGSDGYLYRDISIPVDASYLTFDLMIETPDLGDFLTASLGNEVIYYTPLSAADSDFWTTVPIFIGDFAGQTETLLFTLNHVGDGTPSILLDNITFSAVPEPSTFVLLGTGIISVLAHIWRRRSRNSWEGTL